MTLSGGKRKVNKSLKSWVAFVKKVQKQEKLSYKDAIHRAKVRKDKGEKWMSGGGDSSVEDIEEIKDVTPMGDEFDETIISEDNMEGGRRRRSRRHRGRSRRHRTRRHRTRSRR